MKARARGSGVAVPGAFQSRVVRALHLRLIPTSLDGVVRLRLSGLFDYPLETVPLQWLCQEFSIPYYYVQKLLRTHWGRNLLCDNFNAFIKNEVSLDTRYMVRCVDGSIRTIESYQVKSVSWPPPPGRFSPTQSHQQSPNARARKAGPVSRLDEPTLEATGPSPEGVGIDSDKEGTA